MPIYNNNLHLFGNLQSPYTKLITYYATFSYIFFTQNVEKMSNKQQIKKTPRLSDYILIVYPFNKSVWIKMIL